MNNIFISNQFQQQIDAIRPPKRLKGKDARCDPLASSIIHCLEEMLAQAKFDLDSQTAVVVLTSSGCRSHIERVTNALLQQRPRQGFFSRGGPQMLANYSSIAFDLHGASVSYICNDNNLEAVLIGIAALYRQKVFKQLIIIHADYIEQNCCCTTHFISGDWNEQVMFSIKSSFTAMKHRT